MKTYSAPQMNVTSWAGQVDTISASFCLKNPLAEICLGGGIGDETGAPAGPQSEGDAQSR